MQKSKHTRPAIPCLLLVFLLIINGVASYYSPILDLYLGNYSSSATATEKEVTAEDAAALALEIQAESTVLLQNENDTLPLDNSITKVNVFGWASTQWLGGGSGSGGVSEVEVDLLQALSDYGISYNTSLTEMYQNFASSREYTNSLNASPEECCRLYEPSIDNADYYSEELLSEAKDWSDTALVVIGRFSGESNDIPTAQYKVTDQSGSVTVDDSRSYLNLSTEEIRLLEYVGANYENVIVLLNTGNVMTVGEIESIPGIDACLLAGLTGSAGASVLPAILWGEISPSGKTADTWAYDLTTSAAYANAGADGVGSYLNASGYYPNDGTVNVSLGDDSAYDQVSYVDYTEGIYVGYRWYETADEEGFWDETENEYGTGYDSVVQYPFGYGLSYTSFTWEVIDAPADGTELTANMELSVTVRVTNTGAVAGKDVVQLYFSAPYTTGGIEKSSVELAAFAKTSLLEPGESEELTLTFAAEDMASYDCYDANNNHFAGYELEAGEYLLTLRRDAHTIDDCEQALICCVLSEGICYETDSSTGNTVSNKFTGEDAIDGVSLDGSDSGQEIVWLTRADFEGTFPTENVGSRAMSESIANLNLYTEEMAEAWMDPEDEPITTGADNGLLIEENGVTTELGYQLGADYDDPLWEDLLDQLTIEEMTELVTHAYSHTAALESVGKEAAKELDGPSQIGSFVGSNTGTGFPSESTLAQSWNTDLARQMGRAIGTEALQYGISGWYAPTANLHRTPLGGRNYEYFSEDSLLTGEFCGNVVAGSLEAGCYCYIKHFICNDQESGIYRDGIYTWLTEQTLRELYLTPYQIAIEDYGATGIMTSYNRLGAVWSGGSEALLTGILRDEWNFQGAVITDYSDHHTYMNGDQSLRAGGDLWMDGYGGTFRYETGSNSFQQALRRAAKHILYMYLNARVVNRDYAAAIGDETALRPIVQKGISYWQILIWALIAVDVASILRCLVPAAHRIRKTSS
ncbi:MAG: glycoside hydrolase family 3 C-terminal domain-containing protein [Lachnospiraceae bacterium]|nr:glycoside hydrolase family 3 C-terminal domain-containing protein [Lachnospiraceae bacterium]